MARSLRYRRNSQRNALGRSEFREGNVARAFSILFLKRSNERMIRSVDGAKTAYLRSFFICIENLDNSENNP